MNDKEDKQPPRESPAIRMSAEEIAEILRRDRAIIDDVRERAISLAAQRKTPDTTGSPRYPRVIGAAIMTGSQPDLSHPVFAAVLEGIK